MTESSVSSTEFNLTIEKTAAGTIVRCTGRITSSTGGLLQGTIRGLVPETKTIVLDLTDVSYMDSSGLGAIVGLYLSAKRRTASSNLST